MDDTPLAIDSTRLRAILGAINRYGFNPDTGGYNRVAFSEADMAVRAFFRDTLAQDGLEARIDAAGNVIGRFGPADGPAVMIGSHLDTVPDGGAFDGALGCAVALECVRTLQEAGVEPLVGIEIVATADEEGRFGGMLGSEALVGTVKAERVEAAVDAEGVRLVDAMLQAGLEPGRIGEAARREGSISAFLELHIEQGPVLEAQDAPVGIAHAVSGVIVLELAFTGVANHSGTTPMGMRSDALRGLSRVALALPQIAKDTGGAESRLTIGHARLSPNAVHTIPGAATFTVVVRDTDRDLMEALAGRVEETAATAASAEELTLEIRLLSRIDPVTLDPGLARYLAATAGALALDARRMPSGAGHDAQTMAALAPSALLFVPSRGGISHSPEEFTDWPSIERGARLMANALKGIATGDTPWRT